MSIDEKQALIYQQVLFEHCQEHGLPIVSIVGLPSVNSFGRAYTDLEGDTLKAFKDVIAQTLHGGNN